MPTLTNKPYRTVRRLVPGTTTALLTFTSKMPAPSWSLPAFRSCPTAVTEPSATGLQAICADCYACKGFYTLYPDVKRAQETRFAWTRECMRTPEGRETWITTMTAAILATSTRYFRWHDSGDVYSAVYARCIAEVCKRTRTVRHWVPTRSWQDGNPGQFPILNEQSGILTALRELAALPNVTVRPSALYVGESVPVVAGLSAGSGVDAPGAHRCGAPRNNGECGRCRVCWNKPDQGVSYDQH